MTFDSFLTFVLGFGSAIAGIFGVGFGPTESRAFFIGLLIFGFVMLLVTIVYIACDLNDKISGAINHWYEDDHDEWGEVPEEVDQPVALRPI